MWKQIKPNLTAEKNEQRKLFYVHKDIFNWDMLNRFIEQNHIVSVTKGRGSTTIKWFLENGRNVVFNNWKQPQLSDKLPRHSIADHDYYFKSANGECIYISQPYTSKAEAEKIVHEWAKTHGVKAAVYDGTYSWFYPCTSENADKICVIVVSLVDRDVVIQSNVIAR